MNYIQGNRNPVTNTVGGKQESKPEGALSHKKRGQQDGGKKERG